MKSENTLTPAYMSKNNHQKDKPKDSDAGYLQGVVENCMERVGNCSVFP